MKLSLARLMRQPIGTLKRMYEICKTIELKPVVVIKDNSDKDPGPNGYYVVGGFAYPASTWNAIKDSVIRVDYDYKNSQRHWYIKEDQDVHASTLTAEEMIAMYVARRLDES